MVSTAAQKKAVLKYERENVKQITLKLNKKTDLDILEFLSDKKSKQGIIKECIREYIKSH